MIPKIIHYCWFGCKPLPESAVKCIESWRKYCPGYEIKQWNETNFDLECCRYIKEAYEVGKWAFVSDYVRFWVLYNYGGLYFDTDVELIKSIDDIIINGAFMGAEPYKGKKNRVATGLGIGSDKYSVLFKEVMEYYETLSFLVDGRVNDETVVTHVAKIMKKHGYVGSSEIEMLDEVTIYPPEYFCPMDMNTGEICLTENTRSIHWYFGSWKDSSERRIHANAIEIYKKYPGVIGKYLSLLYENVKKILYYCKKDGVGAVVERIVRKLKRLKECSLLGDKR